jgi:hypothetical protein
MYAKLKHLVSLIWKKASALFPVLDIPVSRIIVFFLLLAFIFLKSLEFRVRRTLTKMELADKVFV